MPDWLSVRVDPVVAFLLVAVVLLYVAARALVDALVGRLPERGALRAVGYWMPIAMLAVYATINRQPQVAVQLVFTTSVAGLLLVLGTALLSGAPPLAPRRQRRLWALVLPVALLPLLAGFHARLTWWHAAVLAAQGAAILLMALDRRPLTMRADREAPPAAPTWLRALQGALAVALAGIGCWAALRGVTVPGSIGRIDPAIRTALILGPGLCIAMTGAGAQLSQLHRGHVAVTTQVTVVLLNLCLLLPVLIALTYALGAPGADTPEVAATQPAGDAVAVAAAPGPAGLAFPIVTWRVDTVLLAVVGLLLIPASIGKWSLGRGEGVLLLVLFVAYLVAVASFRLLR